MKFELATTLAALQAVSAHTLFTTLFVNDVNQGDGTCIRMPMTPSNATFPVTGGPQSTNMVCGNGGDLEVSRVCKVSNGAKLTFLFRETPNGGAFGAIDPAHKGPCAIYMKNMEDPWTIKAEGSSWFKIWDEGYDTAASKWCTEKLIDNTGLLSATVPSNLPGGYYLVRTELLSLHQADKSPPDPQFYVGCAQIFLGAPTSGSTTGTLPQAVVSIPGYLDTNDPSLLFNIYTPKWPYMMPGPVPYVQGGIPSKNNDNDTLVHVSDNAVITNANWWANEFTPYTDEAGCWNASKSCFDQLTACYDTAPPTGNRGCKHWEARCKDIQAGCNAGSFTGPPNPGKNLTPPDHFMYKIPAASGLVSGQAYGGHYIDAASGNVSSAASQSTISSSIIPQSSIGGFTSSTSSPAQKIDSSSILSLSQMPSTIINTTGLTRSTSFGLPSTTRPLASTALPLNPLNGGHLSFSIEDGGQTITIDDSTYPSTNSQSSHSTSSTPTPLVLLPTTHSLSPTSISSSLLPTTHLTTSTGVSSSATSASPTTVQPSASSNPAPPIPSLTTSHSSAGPSEIPVLLPSPTVKQSPSSNPASAIPLPITTVQSSSSMSEGSSLSSSISKQSTSSSSPASVVPSLTTSHSSSSVSEVPGSASSAIVKQSTAIPSLTTTTHSSSSIPEVPASTSLSSSQEFSSSSSHQSPTSSPTSKPSTIAGITAIEPVTLSSTDTDTRVITLTTTDPNLVTTSIQTLIETVERHVASSAPSSSLLKSSSPVKEPKASKDGRCGPGTTCVGSTDGPCSSTGGYCGASKAHCVDNCLGESGMCGLKFVVGDGGKSNDTFVSPAKKARGWRFSRKKRGKRNWDDSMVYGGGL